MHRGLQRLRQWSARDIDTVTISIIGRGILGQQWRQRQGVRPESVDGQDLQGLHARCQSDEAAGESVAER